MTIRILYHQEPQGWWAESPDIGGWSVAGETYDAIRQLAEDGVSFALASATEDRGGVRRGAVQLGERRALRSRARLISYGSA